MINATAVKTMRIPIPSEILHVSTILGLKSPYRYLSRPSRISAFFWFWDFKVPSVNKGLRDEKSSICSDFQQKTFYIFLLEVRAVTRALIGGGGGGIHIFAFCPTNFF